MRQPASALPSGPRARHLPRDVRLRPRPLPDRGLPGTRGGQGRAGGRAHRLRQDDRRRVRRPPRPSSRARSASTTPIKALSNQKYADLCRRYGADRVGLLTGDNSVNLRRPGGRDDHRGPAEHALRRLPDPPRPRPRGHGRVHYLSDRFRGAVWEEGDHPPPRIRDPGVTVGHRVERGGVRRLARHRARPHRGDRLRAPAGAAVPARAGRAPDVRPVRGGARATRRPSTPTSRAWRAWRRAARPTRTAGAAVP